MAIQGEERCTKLISVFGEPSCDIPYYMGRAINSAGFRCLVIDNSKRKDLFRAIRKENEEVKIAQTGEIYYMKNVAYSEATFNWFDYVIIYHGMLVNNELLEKSDFRFLITDYMPITTEKIQRILKAHNPEEKFYVVFKNKVNEKIMEAIILEEIGLNASRMIERYEIYLSDSDYASYLSIIRNGEANIRPLSDDMKSFLKSFIEITIPREEKEYKMIFKNFVNGTVR